MTVTTTRPGADSDVRPDDILFNTDFSNEVRARPGERFQQLFEERVDILAASDPGHLAIDSAEAQLTFTELDARANQLARHLKAEGFGSGDRLALLFDKSIYSYIATLAVLKLNAAYVPLDQSFPADRIAFICEDAECRAILTLGRYREHLAETGKLVLHLDEAEAAIAAQPSSRLGEDETGVPAEDLAYIIYTSGSTGRPKGVPIDHAQIVNFVRVAAEVYGIRPDDRMYQGLTIAFDFAIEEIWVPLAVGATLVPGPTGARLLGKDLGDFLAEKQITALCCVPTLLATLEADLPLLRYIMVSGEACPQDLVARWQRPGRIFLNAYGPTEATVTATLTALEAGKPVTIGVPLPTYAIMMLDPEQPTLLKRGETGEIAIAGIAIARGYLNREEQTAKAFIPDFIGVPGNVSGRIYRTGDLGRINADGEVEYMGRIDTQVKIRGYRIELTEIESVLMKVPGIAQAVVNKVEPTPGAVELAAYYTLKPGVTDFSLDAMVDELRAHVPAYMVPAYFERLETMPLLPSHKADRTKLPPPSGPRYASRKGAMVAAETPLEIAMAEALAAALRIEEVSVEDHFFDDMGANSLLMAQFCTRLRDTGLVADVSMRDTYQHPTVRALAAHLATVDSSASIEIEPQLAPHHASLLSFVVTGIAQAAFAFAYVTFTFWLAITILAFTFEGSGALDFYLRAVAAAVGGFAALSALPVALKWLLVGRWKAERFPVWGVKYFRFWVVRTLLGLSPMRAFAGTALYNAYLRLLGARIGTDAVLLNGATAMATDLLAIGEGAFVSRTATMPGYRARSGYIELGPVSIGARAWVGEMAHLGIGTAIGDDAQLGNASALYTGQSVPAGKRYHGSPAVETDTNYDRAGTVPVSRLRRVLYNAVQLASLFLLAPASIAIGLALFPEAATAGSRHLSGDDVFVAIDWLAIAGGALAAAVAAVVVAHIGQVIIVFAVPRLLRPLLKPGVAYPLYGFHYFVYGIIRSFGHSGLLKHLLGDSSFITGLLKFIGWDLGTIMQTGSNFGVSQRCDVPQLTRIGTGTMVADGLTVLNSEYSATAFRVDETRIGDNNYLGNAIAYPAGGRTGENVLLATKVLVPLDGPVRENVGLLGSPAFEIPRLVKRDTEFDHLRSGEEHERRLRRKNRSNLVTMGIYLLSTVLQAFVGLFVFAIVLADPPLDVPVRLAAATGVVVVFSALYGAFMEHLTLGFRPLQPKIVSIYDPYFWAHERHWKAAAPGFVSLCNGTPFKALAWRLLGVKVGRRLFDDGAHCTERSLVEIGDHVTLNAGVTLQSHTLEEGTFKSGMITLGSDVTVGTNGYINYDASLGDGARLEPDSFLMKGEHVPAGTVWGGNPARHLHA